MPHLRRQQGPTARLYFAICCLQDWIKVLLVKQCLELRDGDNELVSCCCCRGRCDVHSIEPSRLDDSFVCKTKVWKNQPPNMKETLFRSGIFALCVKILMVNQLFKKISFHLKAFTHYSFLLRKCIIIAIKGRMVGWGFGIIEKGLFVVLHYHEKAFKSGTLYRKWL